jgi:thiamine pyrophosphokinase
MKSDLTFAILLGGALAPMNGSGRWSAAPVRLRLMAAWRMPRRLGLHRNSGWVTLIPRQTIWSHDHSGVPRQAFPAEKNFTDGELAVEEAIARGASRLILVGAFQGARTDHALSHLLQAVTLAERGLNVVLTSGTEEAVPLLPGSLALDLPAGSLMSVIGFTDLDGLSLSGVTISASAGRHRLWRVAHHIECGDRSGDRQPSIRAGACACQAA